MDLHGQIMNIQFKQPDDVAWTVAEQQAAKIAHRDARHAAAEMALKADELDALRIDAARYRWLRQQPNDTSAPRIDVVYWAPADESANDGEGLRMEELDAAVDEAMRSNI